MFSSNYADDNVLYAYGPNLEKIKTHLTNDVLELSEWFVENFMVFNPNKCHYICLGKDTVNGMLKFCDEELQASTLETGLGIETVWATLKDDVLKRLKN